MQEETNVTPDVEMEGGDIQPSFNEEIELVDTSNPEYQQSNYVTDNPKFDGDFFGDNANNEEAPQEGEAEMQTPEGGAPEGSGNQYFDAFTSFMESKGVEVDTSKYNLEDFNEEMMEEAVGRYYAEKYLDRRDPRIKHLVDNDLNLNQYMQQQQQLEQFANTEPVQLYKATMYQHLYNEAAQQGLLKADEQGQLSKESMEFLQQQVEQRAGMLGEEQMKERGYQLQEHYKQQLTELPKQLQQQQMQQYQQQIETYNNEVGQLMDAYRKNLDKAKTLVTDFSGQSEKDDFLKYAQDQLQSKEQDGNYKVPFMDKLQNDDEFLIKMLRLSYLLENGYFTDIKNAARKESFESLSIVPKVGKGSTKKGSSSKAGNITILDTSDPDYQKTNYK